MMPYTKAQKAWIKARPANVRKVIERLPINECFKLEGRGHYRIYSFDVGLDESVTLRMAHGTDSFLPGIMVFGIRPEVVSVCGCGKWTFPTPEQVEAIKLLIDMERGLRDWDGHA